MSISDHMIHALYDRPVRGIYFGTIARKEKIFDLSDKITMIQGQFNVHFIDQFKVGLKQNV
jgi:hypothetical protein